VDAPASFRAERGILQSVCTRGSRKASPLKLSAEQRSKVDQEKVAAMEDEKVNQKEHTFNQRYGLQETMDVPSIASLVLTVSGIIAMIVVGWVKTGKRLRKSVIERYGRCEFDSPMVKQHGK
jgi:hypothetical protein